MFVEGPKESLGNSKDMNFRLSQKVLKDWDSSLSTLGFLNISYSPAKNSRLSKQAVSIISHVWMFYLPFYKYFKL